MSSTEMSGAWECESVTRAAIAEDTSNGSTRVASAKERLYGVNDTDGAVSSVLLHQLIEQQVERTPLAPAVMCAGEPLSYAQLNARANQVARYLRARGVGPEVLAGLYFERSPELITALLGILKAGGAYVPLDPAYPPARVSYVLGDSAPRLVLTDRQRGATLRPGAFDVVALDAAWNEIIQEDDSNLSAEALGVTASNLAYVIYTSGSTGEPKGVAAEHRGMVNRVLAQEQIAPFAADDVCCQKTSIGFVDAVFEILGPLAWGRPLVIAPGEVTRDPLQLAALIEQEGVTRLITVPSLAQALADSPLAVRALQGLRHWTLSGEALSERLTYRLHKVFPRCCFTNLYGSSEVAADATAFALSDFEGGRVPIGRPIVNTRVYVLNEDRAPAAVGESGEIYISGACVARGYLNRPDLTSERFLPDPFQTEAGARMYRTGDFGRWRVDGILEYLGRRDHQVKLRGFRIELGEIEAHLEGHPEVDRAAVIAREDVPGEPRLVAYIIPRDPRAAPSIDGLRQYLKMALPDHMVPSAFVIRGAFPLTASGKLDRRALPPPDLASYGSRLYEAPQGEVEKVLAEVWRDLLRVERIGRNENFFELGGGSLLVVAMTERLRQRGFLVEGTRIFESATLAELACALQPDAGEGTGVPTNRIPPECDAILPEMLPLLELKSEDIERIARSVPGGARNIQDIYPLAPVQQGMLFHHLMDRKWGGDTYVISTLLSLSSRERLEELIAALQWAIDRHDILRTAVLWEELPQAIQVVCRQATLPVEQVSLDPQRDAVEQLEERIRPEQQALDVAQAPMLRIQIASDPQDGRWYAIVQTHHLVCDGESLGMLLTELKAHINGRTGELPEPASYRDHVFRALSFARTRDATTFFKEKLGNVDEPTAPFGQLDMHGRGGEITEARSTLETGLARRLRSEAGKLGVSAATLFHAAWALVVSRTSARDDVVFGTVLLGRVHSNFGERRALGVFINTLPLRLRLSGVTAKDFVEQTNRELIELLQYEQASLAEAQRSSSALGAAPLFTALLNYRHAAGPEGEWADAAGIEVISTMERTNYPIALSIDDWGKDFTLIAQAPREIGPRRLLDYLETATRSLVQALEGAPQTLASTLPVLPEAEWRQVLEGFNPLKQYGQHQLLQELFEAQVRKHPQAIAVSCEGESLTYGELNARANQLAWHLRDKGVGAERRVGICMERSLEMVVGLLGILKAGGAYVPLDPSYPAERLAYVLGDAAPSVVLMQERLRGRFPLGAAEVVTIDADWELIGRRPTRDPVLRPQGLSSDSSAYVIYTSGSTGKPKGVIVEHRNVVRLFAATESWFDFGERDVWTLFHSCAFDFSVWELWGALLYGGRVVIVPYLMARSPQEFYRLLCREGVTVLNQTPSAFVQLIQAQGECPDLKHVLRVVVFGGEALEFRTLRPWAQRNGTDHPKLINMYGITETTVHVTYRQLSGEEIESERGSIIGRPIPDLKTYLLDRHGQPVPIGVAGEIYVGGAGVARGYLNRAELTAERFIPDPFSDDAKARLYKTGDLGKWRSDGTIEYLGRNDEQVKIRGFRIELGEIEAQLVRHGDIKEAVVLARDDEPGAKRLVGYVIAKEGAAVPTAENLREHLKGVLPEYMVPSAFVVLEALPLTSNGKLDRRALPAPDQSAYTRRTYEAPRGEVEEILAGIWQGLLKVERVGRSDNFFELGGHSLLIVQMMERLRRVGLSAEVRRVFESPTLSDLAGTLIRGAGAEIKVPPNLIPPECARITPEMLPLVELEEEHIDRIVKAVPGGAANVQDIYPLAPLQEGMLFHHLLDESGAGTYVLASVLSVTSRQRLDELISALQALIDRHDALRTAILWEGLPRPVQVVYRSASLPVEELSLAFGATPQEQLREWLSPNRQRLELQRAPLMRMTIAADPNGQQWYAVLQLHHLVCDNVSLELLLGEVSALLEDRGERLQTPTAYRKHVAESLAYAKRYDGKVFFRDKLQDVDEPTAPFDLMNVHGDGSRIEQSSQRLEPELAQRICAQAKRLRVTAATLFHASWAIVLARATGRDDVVFGTVLLGRLHGSAGGEQAIGMFINTLPFRIKLRGLMSRELIERTQRELIGVLIHEHTSLAVAQRSSGVPASKPLFSSLLNYRHSTVGLQPSFGSEGVNLIDSYAWTNYPLMLSVDETDNGFTITADTDRDIDPARVLSYVHTVVRSLIEALEQDGRTPALLLEILPESERMQLLSALNATGVGYPKNFPIHAFFEDQVGKTPDAVAVEHEGRQLTYSQLNRRANQLARYLASQGVGPGQLVAICMERSLEMIVALLGILKAGGAYLPLDPNYPPERIKHMLDDAHPQMILTETELVGVLPVSSVEVIALDERLGQLTAFVDDDIKAEQLGLTCDNLVYVIYTSGSTGKPKGTAMRHRSVVNLIEWHRETFGSGHGVRVLQFAALSFDVAFQETFSTLCTGGTLVLLDEWVRRDAGALTELLANRSIGRLFVPPLMLQSLAEYARGASMIPLDLRDVITAGEQLRISPEIREFFTRVAPCRLHNHYGPTETHVVTALSLGGDTAEWPTLPPIGRPIANTQIYLLDAQMQLVPMGVIGEIYIGGANVAKGYLNHPELTNQRFVPDRYSSGTDARLYKTGDLGRWREDGTLEYVGRNDDQVKIRGFRIELKEIEVSLARHEKVKDTAVVIREDTPGDKRLVAYITPRGEAWPSIDDLRTHLKSALPEFMIPSAFVVLGTLPLTPSGKLDRKSLPAPEMSAYVRRGYEPPRGELEEVLAAIWQDLLHVERIGRNDNFFELGGHSLLIVQMMERLRRVGLHVEVRRAFESPTLLELAGSLIRRLSLPSEVPPNLVPPGCERITPEMLPLVDLQQEDIERIVQSIPGGAANIQDIYPLVPLQEGMLFHYLLGGESADAYVLPMLLTVSPEENLKGLIDAFERLISRHDVLRTAALWEHLPRPVQVVCRNVTLPVDRLKLDSALEPLDAIKERMQPKFLRLDIRQAPLLRMEVAEAGDGKYHVLLKLHHFLCDHDSLEVLISELITCLEGRAADLPKVVPFRNHVAQALSHARLHDAEAFFRAKLGDIDEPTAPYGLLDIHGDGSRVVGVHTRMDPELARRLRAQASNCGVTAATLFYVAWALVVSKTTGREDVVYGTLLSGRMHGSAGAERIVGMFINTLPIRLNLQGLTARSSVEYAQREIVDLINYEQASLAVAQRCSDVPASAPLFTTLLNYRHSAIDIESEFSRKEGFKFHQIESWTNYPIVLSVEDLGEQFALDLETDQALEPKRLMAYAIAALEGLVGGLELSPHVSVLELGVLPEIERQEVIEGFNPVRQYPQEKLVHELFEGQARLHPNAIAVTHEGKSLTYAELNARANQLAWYLRERGVGPDQLVGICVERGLEMVVGLLGILKAGGAYVPLDPSYPAERLAFMLEDAAPSVVLTQEHLKGRLPSTKGEVISLDADWDAIGRHATRNLALRPQGLSSDRLAYVIYTSGSTGKPKGVLVEHRNVVRLFAATESWFDFGERDVWTLFHSFAFDFSVWELWGALLYGGRVVIVPYLTARSPQEFYRLLCREGVTVLNQTPSAFAQLIQGQAECPDLKHDLRVVIFGGEALEFRALRSWVESNDAEQPQLINMYGITETTVHVTYRRLSKEEIETERGSVIGRPIQDLKIYLLDRQGGAVPIGVAGEIYVGGAGVARGYLNRPELTAERFLADPFSSEPKARMYKTGDLGKWRADGTIEYLGRNDEQVKIRGFRIELGEIEAQLLQHPEVKEALVLAREDEPGDKRLVGYVIPRDASSPASPELLREHLKHTLPEHMVPSALVLLQSFPLTPNGKLDRRALPAPDLSAYTKREYEAPQGEVEEILAGIWQDLLHLERVGRNDNFFELGGHSLLIVQMMERLRRVGLSAEVRRVFESPTLSDLAGTLIRGAGAEIKVPPNLIPPECARITPEMLPLVELEEEHIDRIVKAVPGGAANVQDIYPLAPLQEGMLFHHLLHDAHGDTYVQAVLLSVSTHDRLRELVVALEAVIRRHDVLRTAIFWEGLPQPVQVVHRQATLSVEEVTLASEDRVHEWLRPEQQRLDLARAPLMRLKMAAVPKSERWYALLQSHHLVCDNKSMDSMLAEITAYLEGTGEQLPPAVPYRNHVAEALAYSRLQDAETFFRGKLADVEEPTAPFGLFDVHGDGSRTEQATQALESRLATRLRLQARRLGVTAATLFHAAWALVVARSSSREDVVFGTVLLGRLQGHAGAHQTLGMFINTLPLRLRLVGVTPKVLVEQTQRGLVELFTHEQTSLVIAQKSSSVPASMPLFTALLNYRHGAVDLPTEFGPEGVSLVGAYARTNYPLMISVDERKDGFDVTADTDRSVAPGQLVANMCTAVSSLVEALEQDLRTPVLELEVLPVSERRQILESLNATRADYPRHRLIHELFEEQVRRTPHAVAVEHQDRRLTYAQLNSRANQLARYLLSQGVGPDQVVGICVERGLHMVVGLLGILKAGGAYLPLDPSYPGERLRHMLEDAAPQLVLTEAELDGVLPVSSARLIKIDERLGQLAAFVDEDLKASQLGLTSDNLVYTIYTSGSTGKPKGTAMRHCSVVNLIEWHRRTFMSNASRRVLQFAALSFDVAFQETFSTLCTGGVLVLLDDWVRRDARALTELLSNLSIERLFVPPLLLQSLAEYAQGSDFIPQSLKEVITAGEQLRVTPEIRDFFMRLGGCRLHNHYGPTETHVVTALTLEGDPSDWPVIPPIGRPIANTQIYVLDRQRQPVPIGVAGEIYIGGASVARGYLRRPELTAQRFLADSFSTEPGARMYKTGDLGRWRADGTIDYLGRNDEQVKIRGFRIELGEIEAQLTGHAQVKEAVVLARGDITGEKRLVAYVIAQDPVHAPSAEVLRDHLKRVLPEYMVPSAFVVLKALPLTPSGKLDRRALPPPDQTSYSSREYEAPVGGVEEILAEIWQGLLKVKSVGRSDNFFELGGHSLMGFKMVGAVRERLGVGLSAAAIFQYSTVQKMAEAVGLLRGVGYHEGRSPEDLEEGVVELSSGKLQRDETRRARFDQGSI